MSDIWNNRNWPGFVYDSSLVSSKLSLLQKEIEITGYAYSVIDSETRKTILARSLAEDMVSSLFIEGEKMDYESLYSSAVRHLDVVFPGDERHSLYADSIIRVAQDAIENPDEMTHERLSETDWRKRKKYRVYF